MVVNFTAPKQPKKDFIYFGSKANQELLEEAREIIEEFSQPKFKKSIAPELEILSELLFKNATRKSQKAAKKALKIAALEARAESYRFKNQKN